MGKDFSRSESKAPRCNCIGKSPGGSDRLKTNTALQMEATKIEFKVI